MRAAGHDRAHRHAAGAVQRLHDDHPLAHPARAHRQRARDPRGGRGLFDALGLQRARIRLVGVRLEKLVPRPQAPIQARLDEPEHGWRDADRAVDRASARFGAGSVRPASLMPDRPSGSQRDPRELS